MSLGGGMPRIPGGRMPRIPGGGGRMPRIRDPRMAARSALSRNPLVRAWRRIRSNRLIRGLVLGRKRGGAKGATAPEVATSTSTAVESTAPTATATSAAPPAAPPLASPAPVLQGSAAHHRPGPDATRAERRTARRAARRAAPRVPRDERRRRRRQEGALWRSLLEVGRAQWGADFDPRGLDPRYITAFDRQARVLVTVPRPEGGRRRVLGYVEVEGFAPEGDAIVSIDPTEGRLAVRPEFRIRSATLSDPVTVTPDMRIEGLEEPNGRFRLRAGADVSDLEGSASGLAAQHQA